MWKFPCRKVFGLDVIGINNRRGSSTIQKSIDVEITMIVQSSEGYGNFETGCVALALHNKGWFLELTNDLLSLFVRELSYSLQEIWSDFFTTFGMCPISKGSNRMIGRGFVTNAYKPWRRMRYGATF